MSSARSDSSPPPRAVRGRGGGVPPQLVRPRWPSTDSNSSTTPLPRPPPPAPELRRADTAGAAPSGIHPGRPTNGVAARGRAPSGARGRRGRGRGTSSVATTVGGGRGASGDHFGVSPPARRTSSARAPPRAPSKNAPATPKRSPTVPAVKRRPSARSTTSADGRHAATPVPSPAPSGASLPPTSAQGSATRSEPNALVAVRGPDLGDVDAYVDFLEMEREAMRQDLQRLRKHLADRQLLAEALAIENEELMQAQLQRQAGIVQSSTGSMTDVTAAAAAAGWLNTSPQRLRGSHQISPRQISPQRNDSFAGPSPPLSPRQAAPLPTEGDFVSLAGEAVHDLPLHAKNTRALQDRLTELERANAALRQEVAEQRDELQRLRAVEHREGGEMQRNLGSAGGVEQIQVGPRSSPLAFVPHPISTHTRKGSDKDSNSPAEEDENEVCTSPSPSPQVDPLTLIAQLEDAQAQIDDLREYIAELQRHHDVEQKLAKREREMLQEQLDNARAAQPEAISQRRETDQDPLSLSSKLHALHAMADEDAHTIAKQQEEIDYLQAQLAEEEAEVLQLKQDLAEALRMTVNRTPSDSDGELQLLKDRIAEQDAEIRHFRRQLSRANSTPKSENAQPLEIEVISLRKQVAEQEAEMQALMEELIEAQQVANAASQQFIPGLDINEFERYQREKDAEIAALQQELAAARSVGPVVGGDPDAMRRQLENARAAQEAAVRDRADSVARRDAAMDALREKLAEQDAEVAVLHDALAAAKRGASAGASTDEGAVGAARGDGAPRGEAVDGADAAAMQRALDELRFHDERRRNYDAAKPTTVTRHHREFEGDEWGVVVAERAEALRDAFCCDAAHACHVTRDEILAVTFRVGSLHADFSVRHNEDVSEEELDDRIEEYDFPLVMALYADRYGPKTGLDAALAKLETLQQELAAAQTEISTLRRTPPPLVDGRSAALDARLALLKSLLSREESLRGELESTGDVEGAASHAARADELRSAIAYAEAASSADGRDVDALLERVEEHMEGVVSMQREIAARDEAVTALQEALVKARHAVAEPGNASAAVAATRAALLAELRKELALAHGEQARRLRKAIADVEALTADFDEDSVDRLSASVEYEAKCAEMAATIASMKEELAKQQRYAEALQQELQRARAAHQADIDGRGSMLELYAAEVTAMQEQLTQAQAAEDAARLDCVLKEHQCRQEARQQLDEERAALTAELEGVQAEVQRRADEVESLQREIATLHDTVDELRWYDERRDNCVAEKPTKESYLHRVFDGDEWCRVVEDYEQELRWMLHIDCSRACHVDLEHIARVDYVLGSLHVDFCVRHNTDVAKSELRDRVAEYPFPATWGLYHRVLAKHGPVDEWFVPSSSRAAERLFAEEEAARLTVQVAELTARQTMTRELGRDVADFLNDHIGELIVELEMSEQECTDNLERLEECAALLEEARESERELRVRLIASADELFTAHRQHDEEKRQWEEHEESGRRALSESVARVAGQDDAIQRQAEEIVDLQDELRLLTDTVAEREEELQRMRARETDLLRKLEESAADYAGVLQRLDNSEAALDDARRQNASLVSQLGDAQRRQEELVDTNAAQAAAYEAEMAATTAEKDKLQESTDVLRQFLPQLIAAGTGRKRKSNEEEDEGEATAADPLAAYLVDGELDANELRDALLRLLSRVEQLRRDKENLSDDLDAAERLRDEYFAALEEALRALAEERTIRLQVHERHVQFSQLLLRQVTFMRNSEEDDVGEDSHDGEVASNYEPSSLRSASPPY